MYTDRIVRPCFYFLFPNINFILNIRENWKVLSFIISHNFHCFSIGYQFKAWNVIKIPATKNKFLIFLLWKFSLIFYKPGKLKVEWNSVRFIRQVKRKIRYTLLDQINNIRTYKNILRTSYYFDNGSIFLWEAILNKKMISYKSNILIFYFFYFYLFLFFSQYHQILNF